MKQVTKTTTMKKSKTGHTDKPDELFKKKLAGKRFVIGFRVVLYVIR